MFQAHPGRVTDELAVEWSGQFIESLGESAAGDPKTTRREYLMCSRERRFIFGQLEAYAVSGD